MVHYEPVLSKTPLGLKARRLILVLIIIRFYLLHIYIYIYIYVFCFMIYVCSYCLFRTGQARVRIRTSSSFTAELLATRLSFYTNYERERQIHMHLYVYAFV
jgi:hypothetical protein